LPVQRVFFVIAALGGLLAVVFGAFGAHALRQVLTIEQLMIWEKGVQYQFYHSLALLLCYLYLRSERSTYVRNAAICFVLGITCFSGSLYLLATDDFLHIPKLILGPITPIGGLFFIAGWGLLLVEGMKKGEGKI